MNNFTDANLTFIRERITELRMNLNISECKMSQDLHHSKSYIQNISSGHSLPSLQEFLYICDYLHVTPAEFFNQELPNPQKVHLISKELPCLKEEDLELLLNLIYRLKNHKI